MSDEIIKALEKAIVHTSRDTLVADNVSYGDILDFINRQGAEIERLEFTLLGVMHFVDKWLDGAELEQDEVNRAATMREKTLQIVEAARTEAIEEFADRLLDAFPESNRDAHCPAIYYDHYCEIIETIKADMVEADEEDDNGE